MKKFVLLGHGEMNPTPEFKEAHMKWSSSIQDSVVDSGNPLFNGRSVTRAGTVAELTPETDPANGYSIIEDEDLPGGTPFLLSGKG